MQKCVCSLFNTDIKYVPSCNFQTSICWQEALNLVVQEAQQNINICFTVYFLKYNKANVTQFSILCWDHTFTSLSKINCCVHWNNVLPLLFSFWIGLMASFSSCKSLSFNGENPFWEFGEEQKTTPAIESSGLWKWGKSLSRVKSWTGVLFPSDDIECSVSGLNQTN